VRLLIDTHSPIWFCEGNPALSATARAAMEDASNERLISHATPWEMAIKLSLRRLQLQVEFEVLFPGVMKANGFEFLPTAVEHYRALISLPFHHRDTFDRLLIAQARVEGLTLVSCDPHFSAYGVPVLWRR
jgi:PIN domain nuclease of toxin-antitoxin system